MYKTKLLILLLINFIFLSCTKDSPNYNKVKYSVGYVSGEYDGLILKNLLTSNLSNLDLYDVNSIYKIESSISHSSGLFITNIDNTSDRMRINSDVTFEIVDQRFKCVISKYKKSISLKDALTGFKHDIKHLNGKTYTINNENSLVVQPNSTTVIPDMGMKRGNDVGDLMIEFQIEFPKKLSKEQKIRLKEIL